ncbi:hypothetical protein [Oceanobacillus caeni]|uniref:hypothetical protein n=1 Tax=Oceanobacillus caeni TaxID=405946 RepID=UPI000760DFDE|nr:hypothetical protein [Oceanobacillus caeni]
MTSQYNIKKSFDSYSVVLKETIKLLDKYNDKHEKDLITNRIYKLTGRLIYNDDIDKRYKKDKLKQLGIMYKLQTMVFFLKGNIRKLFRN